MAKFQQKVQTYDFWPYYDKSIRIFHDTWILNGMRRLEEYNTNEN